MSDRELLELAAKAAGYPKDFQWGVHFLMSAGGSVKEGNSWKNWNPLTDDGDALRLAASCGIDLSFYDDFPGAHPAFSRAIWCRDDECFEECDEPDGDDRLAATRRAIVRAAAAIGRTMP